MKLIRDMRRRNPDLGLIELWHRLKQIGYTRRPESLFRVMRKLGMFPQEKKKKTYTPKPYEQMTYPGERVQAALAIRDQFSPDLSLDYLFETAEEQRYCITPKGIAYTEETGRAKAGIRTSA